MYSTLFYYPKHTGVYNHQPHHCSYLKKDKIYKSLLIGRPTKKLHISQNDRESAVEIWDKNSVAGRGGVVSRFFKTVDLGWNFIRFVG